MATKRPARAKKVVSPLQSRQIEKMWLMGYFPTHIAHRLGLQPVQVNSHLASSIRPRLAAERLHDLDVEYAKVALLEQVAWKCLHASRKPRTQEDLKFELTHVEGHDKPDEKLLERAVKTVTSPGLAAWAQIIVWCREWHAKVGGYYQKPGDESGGADAKRLPLVLVEINTREEAQEWIGMQELRERVAIEAQHSDVAE